jgi:spore coat protein U-like protein
VSVKVRLLLRILWIVGVCLLGRQAQAQSCSAAATAITFPNYSPIASTAVTSTGVVTVTCTWPAVTLNVNALVCLNLTAPSPRTMTQGASSLGFDLYTDAAHATQWGSSAAGTTPISVTLTKPSGTTLSTTVTFYGQVPGNQVTVPTADNASTVYSVTYGAQTSALVGFYLLNILPPTCASLTTAAGTFGFTASDTVINNCTIAATGLTFQTGASGLLNQDLTTQGSLTVQCTNNDAYKITLSPGASTVQTARTMVGTAGGATVNYQLYTDSARSLIWGDGTGGTVASTGTGTGNSQTIIIYGKVPAQSPTPRPTTYTDTITATIFF